MHAEETINHSVAKVRKRLNALSMSVPIFCAEETKGSMASLQKTVLPLTFNGRGHVVTSWILISSYV